MNRIPIKPRSVPLDVEFFTYCMVVTVQILLIKNGKEWKDLTSIEGFTPEKISKIKNHIQSITITDLASLANYFKISISEIMDQHKALMENWSMLETFRDRSLIPTESAEYEKFFKSRVEKIMNQLKL